MIATAHALVAGAIAQAIPDPYLAPILALSSHFIMDSVPHWDFGTEWRNRPKWVTGAVATLDTVGGLTLAFFLFRASTPLLPLTLSLLMSVLPDWLEAPWYIFFASQKRVGPKKEAGVIEKFLFSIYKIQNRLHTKASFALGATTTVLTVVFFFLLLRVI